MASVNRKEKVQLTEENEVGTKVRAIGAEAQLARMTLASMLWEDTFYVEGKTLAEKIKELVAKVNPEYTANLAERARSEFKLRHIPLFLARELARIGKLKANTLNNVIQRADEMGEFLSLYWKENASAPVPNQVKKGLAKAFCKFNEYELAKWDKNSAAVSVRDVMFLTHPHPRNTAQEILFEKVANKQLSTPDTWETQLSAGANKRETFLRLMAEKKLGALAFLRNLRGMLQAGVTEGEIRAYAKVVDASKVLPFRYLAAAKHVGSGFEDMLENMMFKSLEQMPKLPGRTILVIDTSGSMHGGISSKSELNRLQAAAALAVLARELCEEVVIYLTAGDDYKRVHKTMRIAPRRGFALIEQVTSDDVCAQIGGGGVFMIQAMNYIAEQEKGNTRADRVIVFTDEQDCDTGKDPASARLLGTYNYILNVGSYKNGINSGRWETITGFSEAALEYIRLSEQI